MKTKLVVLMLITGIVMFQLFNSCRHEILYDNCELNPIHVTTTSTAATVNLTNGTISAVATGGSGFEYSLNEGPYRDTGYFTGLAASQNYMLVARNSWGCSDTAYVTVNSFNPCAGINVVVITSKTDATAGQSNGSITASATGGTGFTYRLNSGAYQSSGTFSALAAGNYTVTAKNSNGCTGTAQVTIGTNNPCAGVTVIVTATKVDPATGQSNGSITASATGGTGFTYSLNNGAFQSSGTFTGLAAGNYTVTAKNSNGCTGTTTVVLGTNNPCNGVTIGVTLTKVNPTTGQSNGSITATATGGTGFTYSLNNGAYQASNTFTGLAAGNYTVTAKSSAGCLGSAQITLTGVNPCTNTTISITTAIVTYTPCTTPNSGKITVTATGSSGFTYNINNGAYQASNVFSNLTAGTYTVGVKDLNGCTKTALATVGTTSSGPLFAAVRNLISTRCNGGGCHIGSGNNAAGYNFDTDCSIVSWWSQINQTCVTYTMKKMPKSPQALLTTTEKAVITNWVNAGHTYIQ
ncbi:MAG TPA: hypothetical protein VI461_17340 [Chitinophagaceae bacterium]|nr:hypothetical protein [Chitinophagaceae bacterium]